MNANDFGNCRANVQGKDIYLYANTKQKFATNNAMKKQDFKAAVDQIEAALQGNDSAPNSYEVFYLHHGRFGHFELITQTVFLFLLFTDSFGQVKSNR